MFAEKLIDDKKSVEIEIPIYHSVELHEEVSIEQKYK
jgi:hypothetical protein